MTVASPSISISSFVHGSRIEFPNRVTTAGGMTEDVPRPLCGITEVGRRAIIPFPHIRLFTLCTRLVEAVSLVHKRGVRTHGDRQQNASILQNTADILTLLGTSQYQTGTAE